MSEPAGAGGAGASGLRAQLVRAGSWSLVLRVVSILAGFAGSVVLARALGAENLGIYAFVLAVVTVFAVPVQLGLPTLVLRETARADARGEWGCMKGVWFWATRLTLLSSAIVIGLVLLGLHLVGDRIDPATRQAFAYGIFLVPMIALGRLRGAALKGLRRIVIGQLPDNVIRPLVLVGLLLAAAVVLGGPLSAGDAMRLHVVAALLAFAVGGAFLLQARPAPLRAAAADLGARAEWRSAVVPLALIGGIQLVNESMGIVILGFLRPAAEVGVYKVAVSASTVASFGLVVMMLVAGPYFTRLYHQDNMGQLQRLAATSALGSLAMTLPIFALFALFGEDLLGLAYGAEYRSAFLPLVILSLGHMVNAFFGTAGTLLTMLGQERQNLRMLYFAVAANLVLSLVLVPVYGAVGAALATAFTVGLRSVLYRGVALRVLGIDGSPLGLLDRRRPA